MRRRLRQYPRDADDPKVQRAHARLVPHVRVQHRSGQAGRIHAPTAGWRRAASRLCDATGRKPADRPSLCSFAIGRAQRVAAAGEQRLCSAHASLHLPRHLGDGQVVHVAQYQGSALVIWNLGKRVEGPGVGRGRLRALLDSAKRSSFNFSTTKLINESAPTRGDRPANVNRINASCPNLTNEGQECLLNEVLRPGPIAGGEPNRVAVHRVDGPVVELEERFVAQHNRSIAYLHTLSTDVEGKTRRSSFFAADYAPRLSQTWGPTRR